MRGFLFTCAATALALTCLAPPSAALAAGGVVVKRVTASSTMPPDATQRFDARHLVDGDTRTWWQPGGKAPYFAWMRFELAELSQVDGMVIHNGNQREAESGELFAATARMRTAWVLFDDGSAEVIRLDPHRYGPRRVILSRLYTTRTITIVVRDFELGERWNHMAISEVRFTGLVAPNAAAPTASGPADCGTVGWVPLRDAVVRHCGDPARANACSDPLLDVIFRCRADPSAVVEPVEWDRTGPRGGVTWNYTGRWFELDVHLARDPQDGWRVTDLSHTDLTVTAQ